VLALDIGGANLKACHSMGPVVTHVFPLWKEPANLEAALAKLVRGLPPARRVAVTMTGELCDCFETKSDGVAHILSAVCAAFADCSIRVWGVDGGFHRVESIRDRPALAAASNWLALAMVAARQVEDGLLIDIGSTTTDLIALKKGEACPWGRSDAARLISGELVYVGVKRTPICAVASSLPHRGRLVGLMAELFATTWDVYLTRGAIAEDANDRSTADGRGATVRFARDRLARMVGEDRTTFSEADGAAFAQAADAVIVDRLISAAMGVAVRRPQAVVISGSGEFLAARVAQHVVASGGSIIRLSERWGEAGSGAACAFALQVLGSEYDGWDAT
jgi:probable H4MPT-linked C1 transfer pathway protein